MNAHLHRFVDKERVKKAVLRAEHLSGVTISVKIAPHLKGDVHQVALRTLHRGVHFLVVPSRREFAVVGDARVHERLGQAVWDSVAAMVQEHFRRGEPTAGLIAGIDEIGRHLVRHFPRTPSPGVKKGRRHP